jgi:ATP-binding cassette subfamily B protein
MPRPDLPGLPPQSIRERVGALRNLRPFLKLIWQTSPTITVTVIALRIVRALLPVATLYVGALIIDAVVKLAQSPPAGATLEQWMASGKLDPLVTLLLLEFGLAVLSDVLGRVVALPRFAAERALQHRDEPSPDGARGLARPRGFRG